MLLGLCMLPGIIWYLVPGTYHEPVHRLNNLLADAGAQATNHRTPSLLVKIRGESRIRHQISCRTGTLLFVRCVHRCLQFVKKLPAFCDDAHRFMNAIFMTTKPVVYCTMEGLVFDVYSCSKEGFKHTNQSQDHWAMERLASVMFYSTSSKALTLTMKCTYYDTT